LIGLLDCATVDINETFQSHTNTKDRNLAGEIPNCILGYTRVRERVTGTRGNDEGVNSELREQVWRYRVIANDGYVGTSKTELLVEIPGERIKVVDHEDIELFIEIGRKRRSSCLS
jgi:hypothetical protein